VTASISRVAFVLAGGAARGAYEVGVVSYVFDAVARALGRPIPVDILCGTSVGAINACALAAHADDPAQGASSLVRHWTSLRLREMTRVNMRALRRLLVSLVAARPTPMAAADAHRGGILDGAGIERLVRDEIAFEKIHEHVGAQRLTALTVSTTDIATGKTVVFVERAEGGAAHWGRDPTVVVRAVRIGADHTLASAAVPFLFPAVRIGEDFYCDGGLRQNVPLSPALHLGADGLLVVNPHYIGPTTPEIALEREASYPGPFFLAGKALNALLLDRIDVDIARLVRINEILAAGTRRFGPDFVRLLNAEMSDKAPVGELQPRRVIHIRTSTDIGVEAAEYVRSAAFAARTPRVTMKLLRRIAEWEGAGEADLLSYLLFDGPFAARLIELGRRDAATRHDELCALFESRLREA
jgi:NTE family protein